eukprot:UN07510
MNNSNQFSKGGESIKSRMLSRLFSTGLSLRLLRALRKTLISFPHLTWLTSYSHKASFSQLTTSRSPMASTIASLSCPLEND